MKALHRRPTARRLHLRRLGLALTVPALLLMLAGAVLIVAGLRDAGHSDDTMRSRTTAATQTVAFSRGFVDAGAPLRRLPDEIEHLLSSMPPFEDAQGLPPTVETDQRCSRVEDGLAHCVMIECQTAGEQTACFEMVVTARRLREPPITMDDGRERDGALDDGDLVATPEAPRLLDTRHRRGARVGAVTATSRF